MNIIVKRGGNEWGSSLAIEINGQEEFHVSDSFDSPEDNTLGRSFSNCYNIPSLMKMAYEAGKAGEPIVVETVDVEGDED
jgi:hypothetical protein